MINVPIPTSPKVTDLQNQFSRVDIRGNSDGKKLRELLKRKAAGQYNTVDREQESRWFWRVKIFLPMLMLMGKSRGYDFRSKRAERPDRI